MSGSLEERVLEAAMEVLRRRERQTRPRGTFDQGGRWWPDAEEQRACCAHIRRPSKGYPYSLLTHCRTAEHVAHLYGVEDHVPAVRRAMKAHEWEVVR